MESSIVKSATLDEISLKDLILRLRDWYRYLLSKWITILVVGLLGGLLGLGYSFVKKPTYKAVTTFVLEDGENGSALGQYAGLASIAGIDIGGSGSNGIFKGDNLLELYKSRTMIEKTLLTEGDYLGNKKLLVDHYIDFNNLKKTWADDSELSKIEFKSAMMDEKRSRLQDSILGVIVSDINENYLSVNKPDKKLSIIQVEVSSSDEFFSKAFNENIVQNVNSFYVQTRTKKSLENVSILQKQTDSVRRVMNSLIYSAALVSDETPNLNPTRQVQRNAPLQRSQFNAETNKAMLSELVKNLELSKMALLKEKPLIQVIDYPILPLPKYTLSKIKGIVVGGLSFAFMCVLILLLRKAARSISL